MDKDLIYFVLTAGLMLGMFYLIITFSRQDRITSFTRDEEGRIVEIIEKRL